MTPSNSPRLKYRYPLEPLPPAPDKSAGRDAFCAAIDRFVQRVGPVMEALEEAERETK